MSIWEECSVLSPPCDITGQLVRVVESQEQIATTHLVDNSIEDQMLLEEMLDVSKPSISSQWQSKFHYLLFTPFRYPPLKYGSRFGTRSEPSLFYGSLSPETAFTETAYYRFLFWYDMEVAPGSSLLTHHTIFGVSYRSTKSIQLHQDPYVNYREDISHPSEYIKSQELGVSMRESGVELFEYNSARHTDGINVALFTPENFLSTNPEYTRQCMCETKGDLVIIKDDGAVYKFELEQFIVDGELPKAA